MQIVDQGSFKTTLIKKKSNPRRISKNNQLNKNQQPACQLKPETVIVNQLERPQSTSVVTLQFKQFQPIRKYSLNKTTKRINAYTVQDASKKMVNIYKQNNKTRYHELFKQTVDQFFKNTLQFGPQIKSILKQNEGFDQRKLINIEKISFPLKHLKQNSGIRHKTSYKSTHSQRKNTQSDQEKHKRAKSFLDANNFILNDNSFSDRSRVKTCKKKLSGLDSLIPIRKPNNRKDYFVFGMGDRTCTAENKIQMYRDLLWKVNYSNSLYVSTPQMIHNLNNTYKVYVGPGNNSNLIKGIIKRRFWWTITTNKNQQGIHFMWTQLKYNNFYKQQPSISFQYSKNADLYSLQGKYQNEQNNIFGYQDFKNWKDHCKKNQKTQKQIGENTYKKRVRLYQKKKVTRIQDSNQLKMHNHLQNNFYIGNKKALFYNVKRYMQLQQKNPFSFIPLTFHIKKGLEDPQWKNFLSYYQKFENQKLLNPKDPSTRNIWIVKPGQNTNRGNGITVCFNLDDIYIRLKGKQRNRDGKLRTFILQKYIQNPMLYQKRKFDIRHYALITCINGSFKAYWYQQGYIRTSSSQFSLKANRDPLIHLTNDAVQKNTPDYGKFEKGNKLSYQQFQKYLQTTYPKKKYNFFTDILPKIKSYATQAFRSTYSLLDQKRRGNNFQLLGLDFMIDQQFNPWLIQVNTNPCLQLSSPLLAKIIPNLIQNTMRLTVDPLFPPPQFWPSNKKTFFGQDPIGENKFSLVFDQKIQGRAVQKIYKGQNKIDSNMGKIQEEDEIFEDQGAQNWEQKNI